MVHVKCPARAWHTGRSCDCSVSARTHSPYSRILHWPSHLDDVVLGRSFSLCCKGIVMSLAFGAAKFLSSGGIENIIANEHILC